MEKSADQRVEMVVARYNEDIAWVRQSPVPVTVYNKGEDLRGFEDLHCIRLKNVGREAHTYLHHILTNWDRLADTTIFAQADPFDHAPDLLKLLNYRFKTVQPLSYAYMKQFNIPPQEILDAFKQYWVDDCRVFVQYLNHHLSSVYPRYFFDAGMQYINDHFRRKYKLKRNETVMGYFWKRLGSSAPLPPLIPFSYSAVLSVPKEAIRSRDRSFYENCMDVLLEDPFGPYVIERMWLLMFRYHEVQKNLYEGIVKFNPSDYRRKNPRLRDLPEYFRWILRFWRNSYKRSRTGG